MTTHGHVRKECEHGKMITQCRCMAKDKRVEVVRPCPFDHPETRTWGDEMLEWAVTLEQREDEIKNEMDTATEDMTAVQIIRSHDAMKEIATAASSMRRAARWMREIGL